jgi:hypothetical protein
MFVIGYKWERLCTLAIKQHAVRLVELLVNKCQPVTRSDWDWDNLVCRVFQLAAEEGVCTIVEHLLQLVKRMSQYKTHKLFTAAAAAAHGHANICRLLIKHGAQNNCNNNDPLLEAVSEGLVQMLEVLSLMGCRYNHNNTNNVKSYDDMLLDMYGNGLHVAVLKGHVPVVKCLLKKFVGTNLLAVTTDKSTVLHLAATTCDAVMLDELLTIMRDSGCDVAELLAQCNRAGETALLCGLNAWRCRHASTGHNHDCSETNYQDYLKIIQLVQVFLKVAGGF